MNVGDVFVAVQSCRLLLFPTVFASCVLVASKHAGGFVLPGLSLRHPVSGFVFPVLRMLELKRQAFPTVFVKHVIAASAGMGVSIA